MFEDPQINKKQLVNKLLSYLQSQDYSTLQRELLNNHDIDQEVNYDDELGNKSFDIIQTL